jgi:hypothetical protein
MELTNPERCSLKISIMPFRKLKYFCSDFRTHRDAKVRPVQIAIQPKRPCGGGTALGILCAMLVASTTNYMGYVKFLTKNTHSKTCSSSNNNRNYQQIKVLRYLFNALTKSKSGCW